MGEIITYEALYEILRREKYEKELQKIDQNFFPSVIKYLEEKEAILESQRNKDSVFVKESDKTQKQLENIRKILREIYEKRENKIVQQALISSRFDEKEVTNLLKEEFYFYKHIKEILNKYRKNILENVLLKKLPELSEPQTEKKPIERQDENEIRMIRFLQPIPQFIGDDLIVYGPFESEDLASLPSKIASILISKNKAEEIVPS